MLSPTLHMTRVHFPFDCKWKGYRIEVAYVTGQKDHNFIAGIYNALPTRICQFCGNARMLGGQCAETYLHRHLKEADGVYQIGYYYSNRTIARKADDDVLTEHIWGAKARLDFGRRSEVEYLDYCKALAKGLFLVIQNHFPLLLTADYVVPVPNHKEDKWRNLKAVGIARELASLLMSTAKSIPIVECLEKVKNSQTMPLLQIDREEAVEGMFSFDNTKSVKGKKIILIDDVLVGGNVKGKCVEILKQNGADKVWILVAGRNN